MGRVNIRKASWECIERRAAELAEMNPTMASWSLAKRLDHVMKHDAIAREALSIHQDAQKAGLPDDTEGESALTNETMMPPAPGAPDAGASPGAWAELEKLAEQLCENNPKLTKAKAIDMAMKARPDLVKSHYADMGRGA